MYKSMPDLINEVSIYPLLPDFIVKKSFLILDRWCQSNNLKNGNNNIIYFIAELIITAAIRD